MTGERVCGHHAVQGLDGGGGIRQVHPVSFRRRATETPQSVPAKEIFDKLL